MRTLSAAALKRKYTLRRDRPRPDSIIGNVYDRLMLNRGREVNLSDISPNRMNAIYVQLTDFYGLDIIKTGKKKYMLIGEWRGITYLDYFAENVSLSIQ